MGNCFSDQQERNRNRTREASQQETELENLPPNRVTQRRTGDTQRNTSLLPQSLYPPQTQTVGQKSNPREVRGEDFNDYMRVDNMEIVHCKPINQPHEAGHCFVVEFTVRNTTSDYLRFTSVPPVQWTEIEQKQENIGGKTQTEPPNNHDLYAEKPGAQTFNTWRTVWNKIIAPNETMKILIQDVPRLRNINQDANGQPRTASRHIDFHIQVPGNSPSIRATQNIRVVNGVTQEIDFRH
ncbi:hypothetical protein DSM106972_065770 [Dulcicalothrix desertica PCC 7102]|uniref:Uncharacterized protein n=1 Tax=Dulcicalothrix desertica PCC 7102 TaxID=232991 RepID=A0A3S1D0Q3_9CYAN|nr:hypothetical protein [Dulcicalothrix desertica]RUT01480.1 hypothetical protein DSM106972_065770 [Dulcicalothrix desertica PCC 7102]TWH43483.1 hypothetical protein CAL7102_07211 [Dulcicalothrix desertica PCC 7102]